MLIAGSALIGYAIDASDGRIGKVDTLLFDDRTWKIRWLVIDTGNWLPGRKVLVHPSAIASADHAERHVRVNLTRTQVEASPDIQRDQPVSMQMQSQLYSYYGWDPYWGPDFYGSGMTGFGMNGGFGMPYLGARQAEAEMIQIGSDDGDPHLRSMASVQGYHIHATDGAIGHLENFLVDDATRAIRYLIIDTRNWWFGAHVLMSPFAVLSIDYNDRAIRLNVSQLQVKTSPPWDPAAIVEQMDEQRLHGHYGWPGYRWS
jgi:hypothetical protein